MSNPQQDQDQYGRRKSKRQRVPNPYYTAGINELKKTTLKNQSKKNRNDGDDDFSSDEEKNPTKNQINNSEQYYNHQHNDGSSTWLNCIMPKSNRHIKVQLVMDSSLRSYQNDQPRQRDQPLTKQGLFAQSQANYTQSYNSAQVQKKTEPQGGLNLLSLFEKVIKNVSDEVPSPIKPTNMSHSYNISNILQEPTLKYQTSIQKPAKQLNLPPAPKRVIQQDKDGKIVSVEVDSQNMTLKFKHSKMGQCLVPIQAQPPSWKKQQEQSQQQLEALNQIRRKLALNEALLKNIAIYN